MSLLVRLDSRLAHGTVCSVWCTHLNLSRIIVVHDYYCTDPFIKKTFEKSAPAGVIIETISTKEMAERYVNGLLEENLMVIFGNVDSVVRTYGLGFKFDHLQVANLSQIPGSKQIIVHKGVCMDEDELNKLVDLAKDGVEVYFQSFPQENRRPLDDVVGKANFKKKKGLFR